MSTDIPDYRLPGNYGKPKPDPTEHLKVGAFWKDPDSGDRLLITGTTYNRVQYTWRQSGTNFTDNETNSRYVDEFLDAFVPDYERPAAPDARDVQVTDRVTLTRKMSTAGGPVKRIDRSVTKGIGFHLDGHPAPLWVGPAHDSWTITEHTRTIPAAEPPFKIGALYSAMTTDGDAVTAMYTSGPTRLDDDPDDYYPWYVPSRADFYHEVRDPQPLAIIDPADVSTLAAIIREVDGNHDLGAAALAEAILDRLTR